MGAVAVQRQFELGYFGAHLARSLAQVGLATNWIKSSTQ
jgi:hypothetical protein